MAQLQMSPLSLASRSFDDFKNRLKIFFFSKANIPAYGTFIFLEDYATMHGSEVYFPST